MNSPRQDRPLTYTLDYDQLNRELVIGLTTNAAKHLRQQTFEDTPFMKWATQIANIHFTPPAHSKWGFGEVLSWSQSIDNLTTLRVKIDEPAQAKLIILNLQLIISALFFYDPDTQNEFQLVTIEGLGISEGFTLSGAWISARILPSAAAWIRKHPSGLDEHISDAMRSSLHCKTANYPAETSFHHTESNTVRFQTFGNCTCLSVDGSEADEPYMQLNPHNIDTTSQQMTLLIGVAALSGAIRSGLYGTKK